MPGWIIVHGLLESRKTARSAPKYGWIWRRRGAIITTDPLPGRESRPNWSGRPRKPPRLFSSIDDSPAQGGYHHRDTEDDDDEEASPVAPAPRARSPRPGRPGLGRMDARAVCPDRAPGAPGGRTPVRPPALSAHPTGRPDPRPPAAHGLCPRPPVDRGALRVRGQRRPGGRHGHGSRPASRPTSWTRTPPIPPTTWWTATHPRPRRWPRTMAGCSTPGPAGSCWP
ncbi:MAG: hypothetical protein KatS3mg050_4486 [Litorilinea sp.]|nr:MAG: hypothetical protein KatS3mg050_4486 [Litorilinea sp.]